VLLGGTGAGLAGGAAFAAVAVTGVGGWDVLGGFGKLLGGGLGVSSRVDSGRGAISGGGAFFLGGPGAGLA